MMIEFSEASHRAEALRRLDRTVNPRLRQVMQALTRHIFAFIEEVQPTEAEWMQGIQFLTETGKMCDDVRQEFILMSDTLGVSMLIDGLNHRRQENSTESSVLGPFYREGAPHLQMGASIANDTKGDEVAFTGQVRSLSGSPIKSATLDVWQTAPNGLYEVQDPDQPDYNLRGVFTTGPDGRYEFRTVKPVSYAIPHDGPVGKLLEAVGRHPFRPAHVHFIVSAPGYETVVTELYSDDDRYLESDAVFGVKNSLVVHYVRDGATWRCAYDFLLKPAKA
jgi:protocatechuate 3,4-dioxygenase beta subunit